MAKTPRLSRSLGAWIAVQDDETGADDPAFSELRKLRVLCESCGEERECFLIPDGRTICPVCSPQALYDRWTREWALANARPWWSVLGIGKQQSKAKRPWLQFHLSTCILLMFVAGALTWANVSRRSRVEAHPLERPYAPDLIVNAGFPFDAAEGREIVFVISARNERDFFWPLDRPRMIGELESEEDKRFGKLYARLQNGENIHGVYGQDTRLLTTEIDANEAGRMIVLRFEWLKCAVNLAVALAMLAAVAVPMEWWTRQRERNRQKEKPNTEEPTANSPSPDA